eukprot:356741-Pyramimonas_sp.AAC.1
MSTSASGLTTAGGHVQSNAEFLRAIHELAATFRGGDMEVVLAREGDIVKATVCTYMCTCA